MINITESTKKKIAMSIIVAHIQAKFEDDIVKEALRLGLEPERELGIAIKVMNDVKEDGTMKKHVAQIVKKFEGETNEME